MGFVQYPKPLRAEPSKVMTDFLNLSPPGCGQLAYGLCGLYPRRSVLQGADVPKVQSAISRMASGRLSKHRLQAVSSLSLEQWPLAILKSKSVSPTKVLSSPCRYRLQGEAQE